MKILWSALLHRATIISTQSRRWHPRVDQSTRCPVCESSNPWVGVSASCPVTVQIIMISCAQLQAASNNGRSRRVCWIWTNLPCACYHCTKIPSITLSWWNILFISYHSSIIHRRSSASGGTKSPRLLSGVLSLNPLKLVPYTLWQSPFPNPWSASATLEMGWPKAPGNKMSWHFNTQMKYTSSLRHWLTTGLPARTPRPSDIFG